MRARLLLILAPETQILSRKIYADFIHSLLPHLVT
jgi:hypothetical protein